MTTESDKSKKKRLTLEYSEPTSTRLIELQTELELNSPVEVLRIALKLLSFLLRQTNDGWEIILRKDGHEKCVTPGTVPELVNEQGREHESRAE